MSAVLLNQWMREHAKSYCSDDSYRKALVEPFGYVVDGVTHTIATNGHVLLDVPRDCGYAISAEPPSSLRGVLEAVPNTEPVTVDLHALRDFLSLNAVRCEDCEDSGLVECDECDGDGEIECSCHCGDEHTYDCKECKGTGEAACLTCRANARERNVRVGDRYFARENLATAIRHLPFRSVQWQQGEPERATLISGEWGRIYLMPVRGEGTSSTPTFSLGQVSHV